MDHPGYLRTRKAADYLNLSVELLNKLRLDGLGPPFFKLGRVYLYPIVGLDAWVQSFPKGGDDAGETRP